MVAASGFIRLLKTGWGLAALAVVGAFGSVFLGQSFVQGRAAAAEAAAQEKYRPLAVVVAKADLPAGEVLNSSLLAVRNMPRHFLPSGTFGREQAGQLLGQRLRVALKPGDPITPAVLSHDADGNLSDALPSGKRALTIAVDEINAMAGMVEPGNLIDLYYSNRDHSQGASLEMLLERVPVLATGTQMGSVDNIATEGGIDGFSTLTLMVDAEQAGRIVLAQRAGALTVVMRPGTDPGRSELRTRHSRYLFAEPRVKTREASASMVEILYGGQGEAMPRRRVLLEGGSRVGGEES